PPPPPDPTRRGRTVQDVGHQPQPGLLVELDDRDRVGMVGRRHPGLVVERERGDRGEPRGGRDLELLAVTARTHRLWRMDPRAARLAAQELEPTLGAAAPEVLVARRDPGPDAERVVGHGRPTRPSV